MNTADLHGMDGSQSPTLSNTSNDSRYGEEELKHFSIAKSEIDSIFGELDKYLTTHVKTFIDNENEESSTESIPGFETDAWMQLIAKKSNKIKMLSDRVARNYMKVVFFGRTSNGKSTSINAILQDKVLPSGMGHTTSCFIQVQKSPTGENFILRENENPDDPENPQTPTKRVDVNSINDLANALKRDHLQSDALLSVNWSSQKCPILKHDVKIVDSPGIDVTPDVDAWIQKYCMDADVFVMVANAESTIMQTEKQFFHRVANVVSKPNIFILINRWDMAWMYEENPEDRAKVEKQHRDRSVEFLTNELGVCTSEEALERVFFVSSREALQIRLARNGDDKSAMSPMMNINGKMERYNNFLQFERKFSKCLSHHAVETRFSEPAKAVSNITGELSANFNRLLELTSENQQIASGNLKELTRRLAEIKNEGQISQDQVHQQIKRIVSFTQDFISSAMNEECKKVDSIINKFRYFFDDKEPSSIENYKKELFKYVRSELRNNISVKCSESLKKQVLEVQSKMSNSISSAENIADTGCSTVSNGGPPTVSLSNFNDSFDETVYDRELAIDAPSIGTDFQEDLNFVFSLGLGRLVNRMSGSRNENVRLVGNALGPLKNMTDVVGNVAVDSPTVTATKILVSGAPQITTAATMGYAAYKLVGWRIVAVFGGSYAGLYAWERVMWNSRAKERRLKRQFATHAKNHISKRKTETAEDCSQQLEQRLLHRAELLSRALEHTSIRVDNQISATSHQLEDIERVAANSRKLRNNADWITQKIQDFANKYISKTGWLEASGSQTSVNVNGDSNV